MILLVTIALLACTGGGGADYTLHLTPVVAAPQTPFDGLERIDLVLTPADGDPLRVPLDAPTSGSSPAVTGLPELVDTRIAVEGYRDGDLVLRGLTEPITASGGEVEARVFVAATETTAWLGSLTDGLHMPMLAAAGEGRFWLAGGATNSRSGEPSKGQDVLYTLTLAPPGDELAFVEAGTLPAYEDAAGGTTSERMGAQCTPLAAAGDNQGKMLITGGASAYPLRFPAGEASKATSLFDPASGAWEDLPAAQGMTQARVGHVAIENLLGNVVVWGGLGESDGDAINLPLTAEVYVRAEGRFTGVHQLPTLGQLDSFMADLGTEGTLLCGGAFIDGSGWHSSSTCHRITLDGSSADDFPELPAGLAGAAAATLPDGRVLVTGGATTAGSVVDQAVGATSSAWLYNPATEQWGALAQGMRIPRVGHRMVALADGRVLVVGGAQTYNVVFPAADAVSCLEIYDPADGSFTAVDDCDEGDESGGLIGRAQQVQVAYDPDYGVLIVGGIGADGSAQGGVSLFVPEL